MFFIGHSLTHLFTHHLWLLLPSANWVVVTETMWLQSRKYSLDIYRKILLTLVLEGFGLGSVQDSTGTRNVQVPLLLLVQWILTLDVDELDYFLKWTDRQAKRKEEACPKVVFGSHSPLPEAVPMVAHKVTCFLSLSDVSLCLLPSSSPWLPSRSEPWPSPMVFEKSS